MKLRTSAVLFVAGLAAASAAFAQSAEDRAAARALIARRGDAVVTVLGTVRTRMTMGGREAPPTEENIQANATMLDERGLAVMSLSNLEPGKIMNSIVSQQSMPGMEVSLRTETTNVRLRLADGREVPARVVLRDEDHDLAFLRPSQPLAAPVPFIENGASAKPAQLDALVTLQRLGETAGWQVSAVFGYVVVAIEKPTVAYLGGMVPGAPVFDSAGRFVGVSVTLARSGAPTGRGMMAATTGLSGLEALGFMPVVLPAEEIREIARQAAGK